MKNIGWLAWDEVTRLLSTRRGMLSMLGFLLLWLAILNYGILPAATMFAGGRESGLNDILLPSLGLSAWQQWPAPELAVYWGICLYLLPFLAVLISADQTASDRSRGTHRYLVLRCSRLHIFIGRFFGQCVILLMVIVLTLASVLAIIAFNTAERLPEVLVRSPVIIVNLMLVLLPYIALMALVSAMAKSARQATLFAVILWVSVSLLVGFAQARFGSMAVLDWVLPGSQIKQLLRLSDWQMLNFAPIALLHTAVLLTAGSWVMWRRDL